jgi:hypothetical protein
LSAYTIVHDKFMHLAKTRFWSIDSCFSWSQNCNITYQSIVIITCWQWLQECAPYSICTGHFQVKQTWDENNMLKLLPRCVLDWPSFLCCLETFPRA